jgi:RecG-like helicase
MKFQDLPKYYQDRLAKAQINHYKFITSFPVKYEIVSNNLSLDASLYELIGSIEIINQSSKFTKFMINGRHEQIIVYDFSKKVINLLKYKKLTDNFLFIVKKSGGDFLNLVDIQFDPKAIQTSLDSDYPILTPVYSKISFQLQSKQIKNLHNKLDGDQYLLDLTGLLPDTISSFLRLNNNILNLRTIHHPLNQSELDQNLRTWNLFTTFLDLIFLNSSVLYTNNEIVNQTPISNPVVGIGVINQFEQNSKFNLTSSQKDSITSLVSQLF